MTPSRDDRRAIREPRQQRPRSRQSTRRPPPRQPYRRHRSAALRRRRAFGAFGGLLIVVVAAALVVPRVLGTTHRHQPPSTIPVASHSATVRTRTTTTSTTTHATTHAVPRGPFPVAHTTLSIVEPAAASSDPAAGPRQLPTVVRYPAIQGAGPFPLIVFSQGFAEAPQAYSALLHAWAAAGFIVAAPTYPDTDPDAAGGPDELDMVHHPTDLRYVIGAVVHAAGNPASPLHGRLQAGQVAVVGQSDGGNVSLAVAANTCCSDPAVRAAVILSGAEWSQFGGQYFATRAVPLLVVQGSNDPINPPACSALIYDQAPRPKYFLELVGASHLPPYVDPGADRRKVAEVVAAFLNAYLKGARGGLRRLSAKSNLGGGVQLSAGATSPIPEGSCPGAP
jgi:predicted dienelactone hydrolase